MTEAFDLSTLEWRKSSFSGGQGGQCVEVAELPDCGRAVRDSKDPGGAKLVFTVGEWAAFLDGAKNGEFDL